jgi:hypothetical protein
MPIDENRSKASDMVPPILNKPEHIGMVNAKDFHIYDKENMFRDGLDVKK